MSLGKLTMPCSGIERCNGYSPATYNWNNTVTLELDKLKVEELRAGRIHVRVCVKDSDTGRYEDETWETRTFNFNSYLSPAQRKAIQERINPPKAGPKTAVASAAPIVERVPIEDSPAFFGKVRIPFNAYRICFRDNRVDLTRTGTKPEGTLMIDLDKVKMEDLRKGFIEVRKLVALDPSCKDGEEFGQTEKETWVTEKICLSRHFTPTQRARINDMLAKKPAEREQAVLHAFVPVPALDVLISLFSKDERKEERKN